MLRPISPHHHKRTMSETPERATCARCARVVYAMESTVAEGKVFHRTCFKCASCKRTLAASSFIAHKGAVFCINHKPRDNDPPPPMSPLPPLPLPPFHADAPPAAASGSPFPSPFSPTHPPMVQQQLSYDDFPVSEYQNQQAQFSHPPRSELASPTPVSPSSATSPHREKRAGSISRAYSKIKKSLSRTIHTKDTADGSASPGGGDDTSDAEQFQQDRADSHLRSDTAGSDTQHLSPTSLLTRVKRAFSASRPEMSTGLYDHLVDSSGSAGDVSRSVSEIPHRAAPRPDSQQLAAIDPSSARYAAGSTSALPQQQQQQHQHGNYGASPMSPGSPNSRDRISAIFRATTGTSMGHLPPKLAVGSSRSPQPASGQTGQHLQDPRDEVATSAGAGSTHTNSHASNSGKSMTKAFSGTFSNDQHLQQDAVAAQSTQASELDQLLAGYPSNVTASMAAAAALGDDPLATIRKRSSTLGSLGLLLAEMKSGRSASAGGSGTPGVTVDGTHAPTGGLGASTNNLYAEDTVSPLSDISASDTSDQPCSPVATSATTIAPPGAGCETHTRATGHRARPNVSVESREFVMLAGTRQQPWTGSRTAIAASSKVSDVLTTFENKAREALEKDQQATRSNPKSPAADGQAKWRGGGALSATSASPPPLPPPPSDGPTPIPHPSPASQKAASNRAFKSMSVGPSIMAGLATPPLDRTVSSLEQDHPNKVQQLTDLAAKIRASTREILQFLDRARSIPREQRKTILGDFFGVFRTLRESLRRFVELTNAAVTVVDLRRSGIELMRFEKELSWDMSNGTVSGCEDFKHLLSSINSNIEFVMRRYKSNEKRLMIKPTEGYREEGSYEESVVPEQKPAYAQHINPYREYALEHVPDAQYYRRHFLNESHATYLGVMEKLGPVIISLRKEEPADKTSTYDKDNKDCDRTYRAVVRIKEQPERRELINPAQIKKSILGKVSTRTILQLLHRDINPSKLKSVEDKSIEPKLLALDELRHCVRYKFGVILVSGAQTTDNEYLNNVSGSEGYERFLRVLGDTVELKGFKGFAGGLDTTNNRTGTHSVHTKWRSYEVMFHVSTLLPFVPGDEQQIDRKRHIGNDIINIIYLDADAQFDPSSIKSQFTHIFVVVKEEPAPPPPPSLSAASLSRIDESRSSTGETPLAQSQQQAGGGGGANGPAYRISVTTNVDVPRFGPLLPEPSVFTDMAELRDFLLCKCINGENSAYKAPKFAKPGVRTHHAMFDDIFNEYGGPASRKGTRVSVASRERSDGGSSSGQGGGGSVKARPRGGGDDLGSSMGGSGSIHGSLTQVAGNSSGGGGGGGGNIAASPSFTGITYAFSKLGGGSGGGSGGSNTGINSGGNGGGGGGGGSIGSHFRPFSFQASSAQSLDHLLSKTGPHTGNNGGGAQTAVMSAQPVPHHAAGPMMTVKEAIVSLSMDTPPAVRSKASALMDEFHPATESAAAADMDDEQFRSDEEMAVEDHLLPSDLDTSDLDRSGTPHADVHAGKRHAGPGVSLLKTTSMVVTPALDVNVEVSPFDGEAVWRSTTNLDMTAGTIPNDDPLSAVIQADSARYEPRIYGHAHTHPGDASISGGMYKQKSSSTVYGESHSKQHSAARQRPGAAASASPLGSASPPAQAAGETIVPKQPSFAI
ncbi:hypothetical protein BC831DRAFT_447554 [Entophlyctis helioformis]|nr:hypothetical protein BC831DRAFT_447554 [Entophlyctis helioformis]